MEKWQSKCNRLQLQLECLQHTEAHRNTNSRQRQSTVNAARAQNTPFHTLVAHQFTTANVSRASPVQIRVNVQHVLPARSNRSPLSLLPCPPVNTHAHVQSHIITRARVRAHTRTRTHARTHTHTNTHTHTHAHTRTHTHAHTHTHTQTHTHAHTHTNTHKHTHIHTHTHTYTYTAWS